MTAETNKMAAAEAATDKMAYSFVRYITRCSQVSASSLCCSLGLLVKYFGQCRLCMQIVDAEACQGQTVILCDDMPLLAGCDRCDIFACTETTLFTAAAAAALQTATQQQMLSWIEAGAIAKVRHWQQHLLTAVCVHCAYAWEVRRLIATSHLLLLTITVQVCCAAESCQEALSPGRHEQMLLPLRQAWHEAARQKSLKHSREVTSGARMQAVPAGWEAGSREHSSCWPGAALNDYSCITKESLPAEAVVCLLTLITSASMQLMLRNPQPAAVVRLPCWPHRSAAVCCM